MQTPQNAHGHPLSNRDLDGLGQALTRYKDAVGHREVPRGERGLGYEERATRILELVRGLAVTAPPRAEEKPIAVDASPVELLEHIKQAREAVLPKRKSHHPKFKRDVISESASHIAFLREFTQQWKDDPSLAKDFPHLTHEAQFAETMLKVYDFATQVKEDFGPAILNSKTSGPERSELCSALQARVDALRLRLPAADEQDAIAESYLEKKQVIRHYQAIKALHAYSGPLASYAMPNIIDPQEKIGKALSFLRYEACAAAQRSFLTISRAYRADRKGEAKDAITQGNTMLNCVYNARWSLLADEIAELVSNNRPMLEKFGGFPAQTKAEAEAERREVRGEPEEGKSDL